MATKEELINRINELKAEKIKLEDLSNVQDLRQHALKIFLNSAYGAFGSVYYPCFDLDSAEAITSSGRAAITEMVKYVNGILNELQGTTDTEFVIAGDTDSISGNSKINGINISIEELFNKYAKLSNISKIWPSNHEVVDINRYYSDLNQQNPEFTYSLNGKTAIKNIVRHKVSKPKWQITIDDNTVEMTGDHSIMVYRNGKVIECKPSEILPTDCLLKKKNI